MWEPDIPPDSPLCSALVSPLVSIVTPCFNAVRFIEETIESVLAQDYPRIEYIVMDGGSTDGTVDILKRYQRSRLTLGSQREPLTWTSGKDGGAADAINRGFVRSHGEIFAYLNADDAYLPGAVTAAVRAFHANPDVDVVYGGGDWIDEAGERIGPYPVHDFDRALLARECFICQPASFIRRAAFESAGGMDPDLHLTFDYELWMRLARLHRMQRINEPEPEALAVSRMHTSNKSLGQRDEVFRETFQILRKHYGYVPFQWVYAYLCYRADGRDQFFEPLEPSVARYLKSLPAGLAMNRPAMGKYFAEWFRVMSWAGLRRRLGAGT
jgi:glycosyltransferase involved in cell wall biosynthesis